MPRHRDPDLEERVLKSAEALWRRGGEQALTMRAVARAAGTNTPAVYRRFRNRDDLIKGLLQRFAGRARQHLEQGETVEKMAEAYVAYAIKTPNEYSLFYKYAEFMAPRKGRGVVRPIRESRREGVCHQPSTRLRAASGGPAASPDSDPQGDPWLESAS